MKELFPDWSDDFTIDCLAEFGYDNERTVAAVFEDNLPPLLRDVEDRGAYRSGGCPPDRISAYFQR